MWFAFIESALAGICMNVRVERPATTHNDKHAHTHIHVEMYTKANACTWIYRFICVSVSS